MMFNLGVSLPISHVKTLTLWAGGGGTKGECTKGEWTGERGRNCTKEGFPDTVIKHLGILGSFSLSSSLLKLVSGQAWHLPFASVPTDTNLSFHAVHGEVRYRSGEVRLAHI